MKPILVIQNNQRPHTGLIEQTLDHLQLPFVVMMPNQTGELPLTLDGYAGMVMMGGPASANDDTVMMQQLIALTQQAVEEMLPYFGICLGQQILAKATGGTVERLPMKCVGMSSVVLTSSGQVDPLFKNFPVYLEWLHRNGEIVQAVPNAVILAADHQQGIQSIKVGHSAYGVQFHPELTADLYALWLQEEENLSKLSELDWQQHFDYGQRLIHNWFSQFSS